MIRPPWDGVAFSERSDGDLRNDSSARDRAASSLGIAPVWAEASQVHGNAVLMVEEPGMSGEADALWTREADLPLAMFTADCLGVVLMAPDAVGVAHAGWRGAASDVVGRLRDTMGRAGHHPVSAAMGPGIGPCCFEVGPEVADRFPAHSSRTTWGTLSVDLAGVVANALEGLEVWSSGACTKHEDGFFSHRADATPRRMAAIGWLR
ncbi:MAG TPA: polyphenol oxidase family protein [Acidimicrobiia bacterium]|nr:polyphenol oxidase family protein [Acidimicrobiia bacterium]